MRFNEQFQFLLNLTATSNLTIAKATKMAPSTISQYKTGKRSRPSKATTVQKFADYFSSRITNDYQFAALSEITGIDLIKTGFKQDTLSNILFDWLSISSTKIGESENDSDDTLHYRTSSNIIQSKFDSVYDYPLLEGYNQLFTGVNGKKEAFIKFFRHVEKLEGAKPLYYLAEDDPNWILDNPEIARASALAFKHARSKGMKMIHLMPPPSFSHYYETLTSLLRAYFHGYIEPFFYPRFRDNYSRAMLMYVPGEIVFETISIMNGKADPLVLLSTDSHVLKSYDGKVSDLMQNYQASMERITTNEQREMITSLLSNHTDSFIVKNASLSRITLPTRLLENLDYKEKHPFIYDRGVVIADIFKQKVNEVEIFDICALPPADDIKNGLVRIPIPTNDNQLYYYTAESFADHLRNILRVIDKYPNYHFIPLTYDREQKITLYYGYSAGTFIVRLGDGLMFNVVDPNMNRVIEEYLSIRIAAKPSDFSNTTHVKTMIEKLIAELKE